MPRRIPKYRHYKPKNLGLVVINGRQHYLGRYGSAESLAEYNRLIQEWIASGTTSGSRPRDQPAAPSMSVGEVILAFWTRHAEKHYRRPDGTPTGELDNFRISLKTLRQLYGLTPAKDFSPLRLKAVRQAMIEAGLARTTINQRVGRIIHLFGWAVENELAPPGVQHGLKAVQGLQRGRTDAREPKPVGPVPDASVDAIRPHVSRQVWALVEIQRLTGMRSGEAIVMRTCDLDMSGDVWTYTPESHKTAHHGHERKIFLGPRARAIVEPWLRTDLMSYLFQPREAMAELRAAQRRERKTPLYPSVLARSRKAKPRLIGVN